MGKKAGGAGPENGVASPTYELEEPVLVHSFPNLYEGVVLKVREEAGVSWYFVHYQGWNKKWYEATAYPLDSNAGNQTIIKIHSHPLSHTHTHTHTHIYTTHTHTHTHT
jgi:hypothetical protein